MCGASIVILVPDTTRLPMSTGSFGMQHSERIEDRYHNDRRHRQHHRRRHRDPQYPHHPAVARRDGKARLQAGVIGGILDVVHRGSNGRRATILPSNA